MVAPHACEEQSMAAPTAHVAATIIRRPHATWHAPPMSPSTTELPVYII